MISPHRVPENWPGWTWRSRSGRSEVADAGCQNFGRFFRMPLTPLRITSTTLSTMLPFSLIE